MEKVSFKKFKEMSIRERDDFYRDDPELYNQYIVKLKREKGLIPQTLDDILRWNKELD